MGWKFHSKLALKSHSELTPLGSLLTRLPHLRPQAQRHRPNSAVDVQKQFTTYRLVFPDMPNGGRNLACPPGSPLPVPFYCALSLCSCPRLLCRCEFEQSCVNTCRRSFLRRAVTTKAPRAWPECSFSPLSPKKTRLTHHSCRQMPLDRFQEYRDHDKMSAIQQSPKEHGTTWPEAEATSPRNEPFLGRI